MRFIPTKIHGVLDYLTGIFLITAPWSFSFASEAAPGVTENNAKSLVPIILGIAVMLYSLFTDYEFGVSRKISMRMHLMLDLGGGILLAASPWLFGFADQVYLPHLIIGVLEIGAALMTKTKPAHSEEGKLRTANMH